MCLVAASKNDSWARHHHLYGLIHGAMGRDDRAAWELERAAGAESHDAAKARIFEALALVRSGE